VTSRISFPVVATGPGHLSELLPLLVVVMLPPYTIASWCARSHDARVVWRRVVPRLLRRRVIATLQPNPLHFAGRTSWLLTRPTLPAPRANAGPSYLLLQHASIVAATASATNGGTSGARRVSKCFDSNPPLFPCKKSPPWTWPHQVRTSGYYYLKRLFDASS
jgi:hypothetical protein